MDKLHGERVRDLWRRRMTMSQILKSLRVQVDIDRHVSPTEHHLDHRHPTRRR